MAPSSSPSPTHEVQAHTTAPPIAAAAGDPELERLRHDVLCLKSEKDELASRFLKANNQRIALHLRAENLEAQLGQALEHVRRAQEDLSAHEVSQSELDRLRVEAAALSDRATQAVRLEAEVQERAARVCELEEVLRDRAVRVSKLEEEFRTLQQQSAQHQLDLAEAVALNGRLQEELATLEAGDSRARREEFYELEAEVVALRESLDAQRLESETERARLAQERDQAVSERDRLRRELESLGTGLKTARDEIQGLGNGLAEIALEGVQLEEEREAVSRMRNELETLLNEREHALEERVEEVTQTRERLEFERSTLQARWDREREEGLVEFRKLAVQLASLRGERDELFQTLQSTRREFESFRNRRLEENEAQLHLERELRSLIDQLQTTGNPFDQGASECTLENDELQSLRTEVETRRLEAEEANHHHRNAINAFRREWLDERNVWLAKNDASEREAQALRSEVQRLKTEVELARTELGTARRHLDAVQAERVQLMARLEAPDLGSRRATEPDQGESTRIDRERAETGRQGDSDEVRVESLTEQIDTSFAECQEHPGGKDAEVELPPRPQPEPGQDENAFRTALQDWVIQAQKRREQATGGELAFIERELRSAREQLLLLHRDQALNDWNDLDRLVAFPFETE